MVQINHDRLGKASDQSFASPTINYPQMTSEICGRESISIGMRGDELLGDNMNMNVTSENLSQLYLISTLVLLSLMHLVYF